MIITKKFRGNIEIDSDFCNLICKNYIEILFMKMTLLILNTLHFLLY